MGYYGLLVGAVVFRVAIPHPAPHGLFHPPICSLLLVDIEKGMQDGQEVFYDDGVEDEKSHVKNDENGLFTAIVSCEEGQSGNKRSGKGHQVPEFLLPMFVDGVQYEERTWKGKNVIIDLDATLEDQ
ncbi:hypothetical protein HS088_TW10G00516 [Tripterygium wilfordii]|uniref:Uncharacterized protein n=1 Tax=Tripterygium wilfordii TaxID=458696 RepID=A0A7J7D630_TRIWF|nr:hypothetical protein HS088_TW10G00516 [Tripterygium wilfordii]